MANRIIREARAVRCAAWLATASLLALSLAACGGGGSAPAPTPQNPVPVLSSISPTTAHAGDAAFTLTVNGTSFISSSRVRWNGSDRTTTFVSSTQLTAAIPASDIATGGTASVTVFNPTPGGGTSSAATFSINNPAPTLTDISPNSVTAGGTDVTLTLTGTNFVSGSIVLWNGDNRTTTFVSSTQLTAAISAADVAAAGTAQVTVFNPAPAGGTSAASTFTITAMAPLAIQTSRLPDTTGGREYNFTLAATGGVPPYTWSISSGALPSSLTLASAAGLIMGTTSAVGSDTTASFTVRAADSATIPNAGTRPLSIVVRAPGHLGRNDGVCTPGSTDQPTQISNGRFRASISPYGDIDVYSFHGTQGKQVIMEIFAQRLDLDGDPTTQDSYLDSMMELLDRNCQTLGFDDDIDLGNITDSKISVSSTPFPPPCARNQTGCADVPPPTSLPYTGTYYIRVRDFRSDGRPDLIYELSLSGAD
jgi:hypothetical protein